MSDILRQALAVAYQTAPHNRYTRAPSTSTEGGVALGIESALCASHHETEGVCGLCSEKEPSLKRGLSFRGSLVGKDGNINIKNRGRVLCWGHASQADEQVLHSHTARTCSLHLRQLSHGQNLT